MANIRGRTPTLTEGLLRLSWRIDYEGGLIGHRLCAWYSESGWWIIEDMGFRKGTHNSSLGMQFFSNWIVVPV